jgi:hypothetical protein
MGAGVDRCREDADTIFSPPALTNLFEDKPISNKNNILSIVRLCCRFIDLE